MKTRNVLALDLGASNGRAIAAKFDGKKVFLKEVHRFSNNFISLNGRSYWDVLRLFENIKEGISKYKDELSGIGIDTWGVDFGLLDKNGHLIANPRSYRDNAFDEKNMLKAIDKAGCKRILFEKTGIANLPYNTLFQLYNMAAMGDSALNTSDTLLMMPNLLEYFLCGIIHSEYSVASTTQCYDMIHKEWQKDILKDLNIDSKLFTQVDYAGRRLGAIKEEIAIETGKSDVQVISVAGHDTASAVLAVPAKDNNCIFISSGT